MESEAERTQDLIDDLSWMIPSEQYQQFLKDYDRLNKLSKEAKHDGAALLNGIADDPVGRLCGR